MVDFIRANAILFPHRPIPNGPPAAAWLRHAARAVGGRGHLARGPRRVLRLRSSSWTILPGAASASVIVGGDADKHGVVSTASYEDAPVRRAKRHALFHGEAPVPSRHLDASAASTAIARCRTPSWT